MKRTLLFILLTVTLARADRVSSILGCTHNLKAIATALEMYSSDHGGNYPVGLYVLIPKYLKEIPACPAAHRDTYSGSWRVAGSEGFYLFCMGKNHGDFGLKVHEPTYSARHGLGPFAMVKQVNAIEDKMNGRKPVDRCMQNLKNVATALEMYSTDNSGRYPTSLKGLTPNYLRDMPECLDKDPYVYSMKVRPDSFLVHCPGRNHVKDGSPANFPSYDSQKGLSRE
ncbi:MAG: hypothetical protein J0I12_02215 [Candidatus Eremiobacteraeota bacterium]|nr:hypothetical protein [Candidatus Eremiobacteraeota bacterium]